MFLLLFEKLSKQMNKKMQTWRWILLCCCLLEGQDRVPRLCSACPSAQRGEKSRCRAGFIWVPRERRAPCASAAQSPGAAAEPGAGGAVPGVGEGPVPPEASHAGILGVLRTRCGAPAVLQGAAPCRLPHLCSAGSRGWRLLRARR